MIIFLQPVHTLEKKEKLDLDLVDLNNMYTPSVFGLVWSLDYDRNNNNNNNNNSHENKKEEEEERTIMMIKAKPELDMCMYLFISYVEKRKMFFFL